MTVAACGQWRPGTGDPPRDRAFDYPHSGGDRIEGLMGTNDTVLRGSQGALASGSGREPCGLESRPWGLCLTFAPAAMHMPSPAVDARSMLGPRRGGQKGWSKSDLKCDQPPPLLFLRHLAVRYSSRRPSSVRVRSGVAPHYGRPANGALVHHVSDGVGSSTTGRILVFTHDLPTQEMMPCWVTSQNRWAFFLQAFPASNAPPMPLAKSCSRQVHGRSVPHCFQIRHRPYNSLWTHTGKLG